MIDVKWDFQGGSVDPLAAEQAVGRIVAFYRHALQGTTCPTHGLEPWLKVAGDTPRRLTVSIEGCCDQLLTSARDRIDGVSRRNRE